MICVYLPHNVARSYPQLSLSERIPILVPLLSIGRKTQASIFVFISIQSLINALFENYTFMSFTHILNVPQSEPQIVQALESIL